MFIVFIANRFTYTNANGQNDDLPCRKALGRALEPYPPDEKKKITEQLTLFPDTPEKLQLTERLQRMMGHA